MSKKLIYRKNGSALCVCGNCGRLHYVLPGESAASCNHCMGRTPHYNIPMEFRSKSGLWYQGPVRVPNEYLP